LPQSCYKFGEFELHASRFELRRKGRVIRLERIPMELLILLADSNGDVVTRQEIADRLWGKDVFLDTEHGINTAVRKIRTALGDDANHPRFVRTIPGKGYRFAAELMQEEVKPNGSQPATPEPLPASKPPAAKSASDPLSAWWPIAGVLTLLILAAILLARTGWTRRLFAPAKGVPIRSIAVLPLVNLSGDPSQDYFADGMTDELITQLAKNTSLHVISRTSAMQYKSAHRPLREIANELGVDGILEGSVTRAQNQIHVTVQLIRAADDTHVWADSYDRDSEGAVTLPSELSYVIGRQVNATTAAAPRPAPRINPEAHDAYLRGRYFWFNYDYNRSQEYMERAILLQPDYAAAWSGLADDYIVRAAAGWSNPLEVIPRAETAVHKALQLDENLAEAHNALAALYMFQHWNWKMADAESLRAVELDQNFGEVHHLRAYLMIATNQLNQALAEQQRASEMDPFARPWALGVVLMQMRRYDDAIRELRARKEDQPRDAIVRFNLSYCYRFKGMEKASLQELAEAYEVAGSKDFAAAVRKLSPLGDKAVYEWILQRTQELARKKYVSPLSLAYICARLQRKDETLNYLEEAYRQHCPFLVFVQQDVEYEFLHSEPRFQKIVKDMGLPPQRQTA